MAKKTSPVQAPKQEAPEPIEQTETALASTADTDGTAYPEPVPVVHQPLEIVRLGDEPKIDHPTEPVNTAPIKFEDPLPLHKETRESLLSRLTEMSESRKTAPVERRPTVLTDRQAAQREAEIEAGRKAQARAEAQIASVKRPQPDPNLEGKMTPVFRPQNYAHETGNKGARTVRGE